LKIISDFCKQFSFCQNNPANNTSLFLGLKMKMVDFTSQHVKNVFKLIFFRCSYDFRGHSKSKANIRSAFAEQFHSIGTRAVWIFWSALCDDCKTNQSIKMRWKFIENYYFCIHDYILHVDNWERRLCFWLKWNESQFKKINEL